MGQIYFVYKEWNEKMHIPYNYDLLSIVLGHTETNKVKV
jgi:hypothetical protein